jgi:hypothetical protein
MNRDYEVIGTMPNFNYIDKKCTFNDDTKPWKSKRNYALMIQSYHDITRDLGTCVNQSKILDLILEGPLDDVKLQRIFSFYLEEQGITMLNVDGTIMVNGNL